MNRRAEPLFREFDNAQAMAHSLADSVAERLESAIAKRGRASLVVSGGRSPRLFFKYLSNAPLAWKKVTVTLADERWVAADNPDSNEALVRETLLAGPASAAEFIGLKTPEITPAEGEGPCEERLRQIARPFDVVLLGMGEDGHTASLFPRTEGLARALDMNSGRLCAAAHPGGTKGATAIPRMTLTLPALLDSRLILFLLTGEEKYDVVQNALAGSDTTAMPVRAVLKQPQTPVEIYWAP